MDYNGQLRKLSTLHQFDRTSLTALFATFSGVLLTVCAEIFGGFAFERFCISISISLFNKRIKPPPEATINCDSVSISKSFVRYSAMHWQSSNVPVHNTIIESHQGLSMLCQTHTVRQSGAQVTGRSELFQQILVMLCKKRKTQCAIYLNMFCTTQPAVQYVLVASRTPSAQVLSNKTHFHVSNSHQVLHLSVTRCKDEEKYWHDQVQLPPQLLGSSPGSYKLCREAFPFQRPSLSAGRANTGMGGWIIEIRSWTNAVIIICNGVASCTRAVVPERSSKAVPKLPRNSLRSPLQAGPSLISLTTMLRAVLAATHQQLPLAEKPPRSAAASHRPALLPWAQSPLHHSLAGPALGLAPLV